MKKILLKICIVGVCLCGLTTCDTSTQQTQIAFYHWQTLLDISDFEKEYLHQTKTKKLYVKYFDVDLQNGEAVPLAQLQVHDWQLDSLEIVPCVFITNRTMLGIGETAIPQLAKNIFIKINELNYNFPKGRVREIQLDCDWTAQSRANYFLLLEELRKHCPSDWQLSATIRLHQVKYFQRTQVPPVDKGMLMYYNMGDIDNPATENSILDAQIAAQYLYNFEEYPLPLDVALPIFAWGIVFRDGQLVKIINHLRATQLAADDRFLKISERYFEVQQSTYWEGYYLYQGDVIRTEKVSPIELRKSVDLLKPHIDKEYLTISFYHLDSVVVEQFEVDFLRQVW